MEYLFYQVHPVNQKTEGNKYYDILIRLNVVISFFLKLTSLRGVFIQAK